ncbi:MAG: zinc ribbon-containing protein [Gammaproteobacteria bacterium]|nr:zinc ribbon-containing protein [Gammaproteobacteria bacterium]
MKNSILDEPLEALTEAYEMMHDRDARQLKDAKKHTGPLLHTFIDEARKKAVELDELTEHDAEKLTQWLKRDLDDAISHIAETDDKLIDWLGFETTRIESALLYLLLETADKTTVELLRLKDVAKRPYAYYTGEITGPGTLVCDQCEEKVIFLKAGHIPSCPTCHQTSFHREGRRVPPEM